LLILVKIKNIITLVTFHDDFGKILLTV